MSAQDRQVSNIGRTKSELTVEERDVIIRLKAEKKTTAFIAKVVKCSKGTVSKTLKRFRETNSNESRPRSGRPPLISESDSKYIAQIAQRDRRRTLPQIREHFNMGRTHPVSLTTVRSSLLKWGFRGRVAAVKPLLRPANVLKRIKFCKWFLKLTKKQRKHVLYTDECKIELFGDKRNGS